MSKMTTYTPLTSSAIAWIFVSHWNPYAGIVTPMVLGSETSGRWLSHESEAYRIGFMSFPCKRDPRERLSSLPWEDTLLRYLSMSQKVGFHRTCNLPTPILYFPTSRSVRDKCLFFVTALFMILLLCQPQQAKTSSTYMFLTHSLNSSFALPPTHQEFCTGVSSAWTFILPYVHMTLCS